MRVRKIKATAPIYSGDMGPPPTDMVGVALETWNDVTRELTAAGVVLTKLDRRNMINLAMAAQHGHDAQLDIEQNGLKSITERGEVKNGSFTIQTTAALTYLRISAAYGLTPASRNKVTVVQKAATNPFAEL